MARKTKRQKSLEALRVTCLTVAQMTQEPDADPVDLLHRLQGAALLLDPVLRLPRTREAAIHALAELTWKRLEAADEAYRDLSPQEQAALKGK